MLALPVLMLTRSSKVSFAAEQTTNTTLYASISIDGKVLTDSELETIEGVTYVISNTATTINFMYLDFNYRLNLSDPTYFYPRTEKVVLERDAISGEFPTSFTIGETTLFYSINGSELIIYKTPTSPTASTIPTLHSTYNDLISFEETSETITISLITSYTLDESAPDSFIQYDVYQYQSLISGETGINISFTKPIINFNTNDILSFTCTGLDVGSDPFVDSKIPREHSYANTKITFKNNDYVESNPLYFDINHNGFVYTYKLYSKEINSEHLLFVEYYDDEKPANNQSLATTLNADGSVSSAIYKYDEPTTNFNEFSIDFNKTGRYEISVYDKTYLLGLTNNNFYSTSFYIKNENAENSAFENVYVIFQTQDDEGLMLDYVVSESTLNNNVLITIKNLSFYFKKDTVLADDDIVLDFTTTTFAGSTNVPVTESYTKKQLLEMLDKNEDWTIVVSEDAFYELTLYQWHEEEYIEDGQTKTKKIQGGTVGTRKYYQNYNFTVIKAPKTSFTKYETNEDYEVVEDDQGNPLTTTKVATVPYEVVRDYNNFRNIKSTMTINFEFTTDMEPRDPITLNKTYINNYYVDYAMQEVLVEQFDMKEPDSDTILKQLNLRFLGIGNITATITVNGKTTVYELTEETGFELSFVDYGIYQVSFVDSMGTTHSEVFKYEKPVSMSSVILIVLVGIIVLAVVLFIVLSRGKLKTR